MRIIGRTLCDWYWRFDAIVKYSISLLEVWKKTKCMIFHDYKKNVIFQLDVWSGISFADSLSVREIDRERARHTQRERESLKMAMFSSNIYGRVENGCNTISIENLHAFFCYHYIYDPCKWITVKQNTVFWDQNALNFSALWMENVWCIINFENEWAEKTRFTRTENSGLINM